MKKISLLLLSLFLITTVQAEKLDITISSGPSSAIPTIKSSVIQGTDQVTIGEEFALTFNINFSGLFKNMPDTFGILSVAFELQFDDSIFTVTNVSVNDWITTVSKMDESYLVQSIVNDNNSSNKCIDGYLYCSNYSVTIQFKVNETDKTFSTIKIGDMAAGLLNVDYIEELSDATNIIEGTSDQSKTIKIEVKSKEETKHPESSKSEIPSNTTPELPREDNSVKSNNTYLKSLQIENHNINFLKTKNEYNILVAKDENQLIIKAEVEDTTSTYQIIGADNLVDNDYKVQIEVTAANGEKNIYLLNVSIREESGIVYENPKEEKKSFKFVWKKTYAFIGIGLLLFIIFIGVIVKVRDKKIDKGLDEFL